MHTDVIIPLPVFEYKIYMLIVSYFFHTPVPPCGPGCEKNRSSATPLPVVKGDINGGNLFAVGCNPKGRRKGSWWLRFADTGVYSVCRLALHFGPDFC
jgi:hypothetical protein